MDDGKGPGTSDRSILDHPIASQTPSHRIQRPGRPGVTPEFPVCRIDHAESRHRTPLGGNLSLAAWSVKP